MLKTGTIYGINGPVIYLKGNTGFKMSEMVYVGKERLVGEVIALDKDKTTIQVFEETTGLRPGETVEATGDAISVTLAPGILNNIFDGIERPLERIAEHSGAFISRGVSVDSLDRTKKWDTHMTVSVGDSVHGGDIIAEVPETTAIVHKCMIPPHISGLITKVVPDGAYTIDEPLVTVELDDRSDNDTKMADSSTTSNTPSFSGIRSADYRTAYFGYYVPDCKRRNCLCSRRLRNRKNYDTTPDCQMVRR